MGRRTWRAPTHGRDLRRGGPDPLDLVDLQELEMGGQMALKGRSYMVVGRYMVCHGVL